MKASRLCWRFWDQDGKIDKVAVVHQNMVGRDEAQLRAGLYKQSVFFAGKRAWPSTAVGSW
jgi:hypothetical protein